MVLQNKNIPYYAGILSIGALGLFAYRNYQRHQASPQFLDNIFPAEVQPYILPAALIAALGLGAFMFIEYRQAKAKQSESRPGGLTKGFTFKFR